MVYTSYDVAVVELSKFRANDPSGGYYIEPTELNDSESLDVYEGNGELILMDEYGTKHPIGHEEVVEPIVEGDQVVGRCVEVQCLDIYGRSIFEMGLSTELLREIESFRVDMEDRLNN